MATLEEIRDVVDLLGPLQRVVQSVAEGLGVEAQALIEDPSLALRLAKERDEARAALLMAEENTRSWGFINDLIKNVRVLRATHVELPHFRVHLPEGDWDSIEAEVNDDPSKKIKVSVDHKKMCEQLGARLALVEKERDAAWADVEKLKDALAIATINAALGYTP